MHTRFLKAVAIASATLLPFAWQGGAHAQDIQRIKIGAVAPKTGPLAGGAAMTQWPNIRLWVEQTNKAGGIMLKSVGKRVPVELIEYDDRTNNEDTVKAIERLATQDKADFIIAPYATGANLAAAPVFAKYGYPQLAVNSVTDRGPELGKRWPNSFWLLGGGSGMGKDLVVMLKKMQGEGKIGDTVALSFVADGFGLDMANGTRKALKEAGFKVVYDKSYPLGTQDLSPVINEVKALNPDVFLAFSYPPDTFGLTEQARIAGFNPKVFHTGVGTPFPDYRDRFGAAAVEGVMGTGGWDPSTPKMQAYVEAHKALNGKEPDGWASSVTYASLEMLTQAIERVGSLDRKAVAKELQSGSFDTVIGTVKLKGNVREQPWAVGQWQNGVFRGVAPHDKAGAVEPVAKPGWK